MDVRRLGWFCLLTISLLLAVTLVNLLPVQTARAAYFTVTKLEDSDDHDCSPSDCSLREAIEAAGDQDEIDFGTLVGTIVLDSELVIDKMVYIHGEGTNITLSGGSTHRIFRIDSDWLSIDHVTIQDGYQSGAAAEGGAVYIDSNGQAYIDYVRFINNQVETTTSLGGSQALGGAIYNAGTLYLGASDFTNNSVLIHEVDAGASGQALGGAIYSSGYVNLSGGTLEGNAIQRTYVDGSDATCGGGAVYASGLAAIRSATLSGNHVDYCSARSSGGAVLSSGTLVIEQAFIEQNQAFYGAGLETVGGNVTITNSSISNNEASYGGGYLVHTGSNPTITGSTFQANTALMGGGLYISPDVVAGSIEESILQYNVASQMGGGIYAGGYLFLDGSNVVNNQAGRGGGIAVESREYLLLTESNVQNNSADEGGGIYVHPLSVSEPLTHYYAAVTLDSNEATLGMGGGMLLAGDSSQVDLVLNFQACTVSRNVAAGGGGGIAMTGYSSPGASEIEVRMYSSTLSGNLSGGSGGGLYVTTSFPTYIEFYMRHVTITDNLAQGAAGGIYQGSSAGIELRNSVLSGNHAPLQPDTLECSGTINSMPNNLFGILPGCTIITGDTHEDFYGPPGVYPLADNGSTTETHALETTSLAVDNGDPNECITTDQRGYPTNYLTGGLCDLGAYEIGSFLRFVSTSASVFEGASGTTTVFPLELSVLPASSDFVSFDYQTISFEAETGIDLQFDQGTMTFFPGQTSKIIDLTIIGDDTPEPDERARVWVHDVIGAQMEGTSTEAVITILDDDGYTEIVTPRLQPMASEFNIMESAGSVEITVILDEASTDQVMVSYQTTSVSALSGIDFSSTLGTLAFDPGEMTSSFSIPITDDGILEGEESFSVVLFNPIGGSLGAPNPVRVVIEDDDYNSSDYELSFTSLTYDVNESADQVLISASLYPASPKSVTVEYTTQPGGTATEELDFTSLSGELYFMPGETLKTFSLPILEDTDVEDAETVLLSLDDAINAEIVNGAATLTIHDNDGGHSEKASLQFSASLNAVGEGDSGIQTASIQVSRTGDTESTVSVNYDTEDLTAMQPGDYEPASGTLTFNPGELVKTFSVEIKGDEVNEQDEVIRIGLSSPEPSSDVILGGLKLVQLTILDDDDPAAQPRVVLSADNYVVSEAANFVTVTYFIVGDHATPISLTLATVNGSATAPVDYTTVTINPSIDPSIYQASVEIPISNDTDMETFEYFTLILSEISSGALLGNPHSARVTILDDDITRFVYIPMVLK